MQSESSEGSRETLSMSGLSAAGWLLAWAIGVALLLVPILVINFVSAIRTLRRHGVPRPLFVMTRRVLGLLPIRSQTVPAIDGCQVLVAWDLRWMYGGETTGRVSVVHAATRELEIELDRPIPIVETSGHESGVLRRVTFVPRNTDRAPYGSASVSGKLLPPLPGGVIATAEVVVYPRRRAS